MKKSMLFGAICSIAGCFAIVNASAQKSDEAAIKKVMQTETSAFFHKDYDGWANTWAHDTAASILRAGTNGYQQLLGWNAIAAAYKQDIKNLRNRSEEDIAPFLNKHDFHIYVNGNVATVSCKEGDKIPDTEMRTLVKQNGEWKILNFTMINNDSYAMRTTINNLKAFAGQWELDGKPTVDPPRGGELNSLKFELKETPDGLEQRSEANYTINHVSYNPPAESEFFIPDYNANTVSYLDVSKNSSGQTFPQTGTVTSDQPNSFTVTVMYSDKPTAKEGEYTVTMVNGKWHQVGKQYDRDGKTTMTSTIDMHRL